MPSQIQIENYTYSGQGIVMMAERDNKGQPKGFRPIGSVSELTISLEVNNVELKESYTGQRSVLKQLRTETKANVKMVLSSLDRKNLAMGLYGKDISIDEGDVKDEPIIAYLGAIVPLTKLNVSKVKVKSATGGIIYEENKNYTVNPEAGSLNLLDEQDQADRKAAKVMKEEEGLLVDYHHTAQIQVDALTTGQPERYLRFEGLNTSEDNKPVVVEVFRLVINPLQNLALINDEFASMEIEGAALVDPLRQVGTKFFKQQWVA
jgi:hypothetical protein